MSRHDISSTRPYFYGSARGTSASNPYSFSLVIPVAVDNSPTTILASVNSTFPAAALLAVSMAIDVITSLFAKAPVPIVLTSSALVYPIIAGSRTYELKFMYKEYIEPFDNEPSPPTTAYLRVEPDCVYIIK